MERPPRNASHFQSIKCSVCGRDIDLVSISDHVCSTPSSDRSIQPHAAPLPPTTNFAPYHPSRDASFLKPQRPALPKIDSSVASELTPASSGNGSVGSPVSATSGRKSPWRGPVRKPTIMVQQGPPSPELVNLDCAFPPFPALNPKESKKDEKPKTKSERHVKSRPTSPTSSVGSLKQYPGPSPLSRTVSNGSSRQRSKSVTGENRLRRPSISNGGRRPSISNNGSRKPSTEDIPPMPTPSPDLVVRPPPIRPLERSETAPIVPTVNSASHEALSDLQRHVTTDGVLYHEPEQIGETSNEIAGLEFEFHSSNPFPLAQAPKESEPAYRSKRPPPIVSNIAMAPRGLNPKMRSPTVPPPSSATSLSRSLTKLFGRRRSQSASAARRDIVRSALSDEHENEIPTPPIPDSALEAPTPLLFTPQSTLGSETQASPAALDSESLAMERADSLKALEGPAPGPLLPTLVEPLSKPDDGAEAMHFNFDWDQPESKNSPSEPPTSGSIARRPTEADRTSIDSASSYGSIGFDERTASSRSSAPPTDELIKKFSDSVQPEPVRTTSIDIPPLRPRNTEIIADSPTDPLFIDGRLSPIPTDKPKPVELAPTNVAMPPPPRPVRPARKDSLATVGNKTVGPNKGTCKGCSQPILPNQKSVTSADGRLTGRYHKDCFVCTTCKSAFATSEFYVHGDRPYCAYHYHEQENSLCATCGKGIEGLYMETANVAGRGREKHHPRCLKCTTCRIQLSNDYFELSGKVYCERDAFRLASVPRVHDRSPARPSPLVREYISSGDPKLLQKGANFPERRITRIMTTT